MRVKKSQPRAGKILKIIVSVLLGIIAFLELGMVKIHTKGAWKPDYEKKDISSLITQTKLSDDDYKTLYYQTGLSRKSLEQMLANNEHSRVLDIQTAFFTRFEEQRQIFAPFTCSDRIEGNIPLASLEDGDIIISPSSHFSFLRSGHAAIVVNAKEGRIINATGFGYKSSVEDVSDLSCRPAFIVLRLKEGAEKRSEIARFSYENLLGIKYRLTAGLFEGDSADEVKSTHCGHLVWYAFNRFGYDLDSNSGPFVWPRDIANSEHLEVVQIYGIDPNKRF